MDKALKSGETPGKALKGAPSAAPIQCKMLAGETTPLTTGIQKIMTTNEQIDQLSARIEVLELIIADHCKNRLPSTKQSCNEFVYQLLEAKNPLRGVMATDASFTAAACAFGDLIAQARPLLGK